MVLVVLVILLFLRNFWATLIPSITVPLALMGWLPPWLAGLGMAASSLLVVLNALRLSSSAEPPATEVP